jgi:CubicO group peptidase (beta-lactamase class C family)
MRRSLPEGPSLTDAFTTRFGFPRSEVSLANWRLAPYSAWSFHNAAEMVPSAVIAAADGSEPPAADPSWLLAQTRAGGAQEKIDDFLRRSHTDALVVMKDGKFVADFHAPHHDPRAPHIVFSISKSLTAILAGMLQEDGALDPNSPITDHVPEVAGSAYGDATVRHLLDMAVALDFDESYLDPESDFARYRRAMLWNPQLPGRAEEAMLGFLASLKKGAGDHGAPFRYRSPNSDLLGIVVERAAGRRYAELMSQRLWKPMGAKADGFVTVDREGTARAAGGVSVTARDLARVGELMRNGGVTGGKRVLPESWVQDTLTGGDADAWRQGDFAHLLENGRYRNKWYQTGFANGAFFAIGIHGQWLWVDPEAAVVVVRLSSQPEPVDDPLDLECIALFSRIAELS